MILKKLNLKNCGNFSDETFEFDDKFTLIYGNNETGKSTTQDSIIDALFGNVQKEKYSLVHGENQIELNFDIEDNGEEFGFSQKGGFSQKTVRGADKPYNSRSDFKNRFIANGIDKKFYQNMFALTHQRLRDENIALLHNNADISNILFGAMAGSDTINTLSSTLEKKSNEILATSGTEPRIKYLAKQIKELKQQINENKFDTQSYNQKTKEIDALKKEIDSLTQEQTKLENDQKELNGLLSSADVYFQIKELEEKLKTKPIWESDNKLLEEWETRYSEYKELLTKNTTLKEQLSKTTDEFKNLTIDENILSKKQTIEDLATQAFIIKQNQDDLKSKENELRDLENKISDAIEELGIKKDISTISKEDLQSIAKSQNLYQELQSLISKLEQNLSQNIPQTIDTNKVKNFKENFSTLEAKIADTKKEIQRVEKEKKTLESKITQDDSTVSFEQFEAIKSSKSISWETLKENISSITSSEDKTVADYERIDKEYDEAVKSILKDAQKFAEQKIAIEKLQEITSKLEELNKTLDTQKSSLEGLQNEWLEFVSNHLNSNKNLSIDHFDTWDRLRTDTQKNISDKSKLQKEIKNLQDTISIFLSSLESLQKELNTTKTLNEIKKDLDKSTQDQISKTTLEKSINFSNEEISDLEKSIEKSKLELYDKLPQELKTTTLDEVPNQIKSTQEYNRVSQDLQTKKDGFEKELSNKLQNYSSKKELQELFDENIQKLDELKKNIKSKNDEKNQKEKEIEELLKKDEEIEQNTQKITSLKEKLKDMVEEYIKLKVAAQAIPKLITELSSENQDEIISKAKEYFAIFTNGNYTELSIENEALVAKRKKVQSKLDNNNITHEDINDTINVTHLQMSEGTRDQLFLSLRLAFITMFNEKSDKKLPFLADDILINFDEDRIIAGLKLLKEFSKHTQIIFFTHSKRVEELYLNLK